jgi:hypothetical protein
MLLAILLLSLWVAMAIVIFISHGRQEYCLTKHLVIFYYVGFGVLADLNRHINRQFFCRKLILSGPNSYHRIDPVLLQIIIFNTGFCITLVLAAITPCARTPASCIGQTSQSSSSYAGRLVQVLNHVIHT